MTHSVLSIQRKMRNWHLSRNEDNAIGSKWYGCDHASGFARYFKKQFERIKHWDCIDVEEGLNRV
jgi:hypothetical protein